MLLLKARKASACSGGYRGGPPLFLDQTEAPPPHPQVEKTATFVGALFQLTNFV